LSATVPADYIIISIIIIIIIIVYYANKAAYTTHTYKMQTQTQKDKKNTQHKIHNTLKYAI